MAIGTPQAPLSQSPHDVLQLPQQQHRKVHKPLQAWRVSIVRVIPHQVAQAMVTKYMQASTINGHARGTFAEARRYEVYAAILSRWILSINYKL
jgi:hypothetical protein